MRAGAAGCREPPFGHDSKATSLQHQSRFYMAPTVGCQAKPRPSEGSSEAPERLSDTWADVSLRSNRLSAGVFLHKKHTGRVGESTRNFRKLTGDLQDDPRLTG